MDVVNYPLHTAARLDQADVLLDLIHSSPSHEVNKSNFDLLTPLHEACFAGSTDCVKLLLDHGAWVNVRTIDGATPLCIASGSGSTECVKILLSYGADINPSLNFLTSPLHEAVTQGHTGVITQLIDAGAHLEANDLHYGTPLHVAARHDNTHAARLLLAAGAGANAVKNHTAALHLAAQNNSIAMATVVIEFGASVFAQDAWKQTPRNIVLRMYGTTSLLHTYLLYCEGQVLENQSPWRLSIVPDIFWGIVNFVVLFFRTMINPSATSRGSGHSTDYRASGRGPDPFGPGGGPRRRMGGFRGGGGGPAAPPMAGGG